MKMMAMKLYDKLTEKYIIHIHYNQNNIEWWWIIVPINHKNVQAQIKEKVQTVIWTCSLKKVILAPNYKEPWQQYNAIQTLIPPQSSITVHEQVGDKKCCDL